MEITSVLKVLNIPRKQHLDSDLSPTINLMSSKLTDEARRTALEEREHNRLTEIAENLRANELNTINKYDPSRVPPKNSSPVPDFAAQEGYSKTADGRYIKQDTKLPN